MQILRTCSMPDLKKVLNAELPEDGDFVVGHKNIDESDHVEGAVSNNIPGSQIAEADDQAVVPMEQAQLKDDHPEVYVLCYCDCLAGIFQSHCYCYIMCIVGYALWTINKAYSGSRCVILPAFGTSQIRMF